VLARLRHDASCDILRFGGDAIVSIHTLTPALEEAESNIYEKVLENAREMDKGEDGNEGNF
jgi:hypothetical protein